MRITETNNRGMSAPDLLSDPRTGLPTAGVQRAQLGHALARASRFGTTVALLFIDLDHLGVRVGDAVADKVHTQVAARLKACLRGTDLTAQLEGDEFVIVCEDLAASGDVDIVAARITAALLAPVRVGDVLVDLRATVGTATSAGADEPGALLVAADEAMSRIKRTRST